MKNINTIKINFKGGIISPGELYNILVAAEKSGLLYVRFGLRQQLLLDVAIEELENIKGELDELGIHYEINKPGKVEIVAASDELYLRAFEMYRDRSDSIRSIEENLVHDEPFSLPP